MKQNLSSQIVESIKADAEKFYPVHNRQEYGGDCIVTFDVNKPRRDSYTAGRQEQLVKDLEEFIPWKEENFSLIWCGINMGKYYRKGEDIMTGTPYTTLELYSLYINQKK